jgi:transcriptional regulator with XRE-family HTH domain
MDWKSWGDRLRTLRTQREWTQSQLGAMVSVSRNTVNRWEIGDRRPSMRVLEKLARVFSVTIHALLRDRLVAVKRLTFDAARAFPLSESYTVPVIGLMMATDDARHLQKLLIIGREKSDEAPDAERAIVNGELGHLFRLLCGHLHEAKEAFLSLERKNPQLLDGVVKEDPDGVAALRSIRKIYAEKPTAKRKPFMAAVRNFVAFHYNEAMLGRALRKHLAVGHLEGAVTLSPRAGIGRYTMTDGLATLLLSDELGGQIGDFEDRFGQKVGDVIALAGALGYVVDLLVGYLVLGTNAADVKTEDGVVRVDPLIEQARRAIMAERAKAGTR